MSQKLFITGGSGFIGLNLQEYFRDQLEVYAPPHAELELLDEKAVFQYLKRTPFDYVIHCATWDAARNSVKAQDEVYENNLKMFFNIARHPDLFGKLLFYGSGAEYDRRHLTPRMNEDYFGAHVPPDPYGASVYRMTQHALESENIFNMRLFGVFGPHEDWEIRFISNACCKAVWDLPITIKQNAIFDYLYIKDLMKITGWFLEHAPDEHVYNVCRGRTYELTELARIVRDVTGKDLEIRVLQDGLDRNYSGDNSRLLGQLGNFDFTPINEAIAATYAWYEQHKDRIDRDKLLIDK